MVDADAPETTGGLHLVLVPAVGTCALVTVLGGTLLGLNWTQALLLGGVAAVVAAFASRSSARRVTPADE